MMVIKRAIQVSDLAATFVVGALPSLGYASEQAASLPGVNHVGKAKQHWLLQCQGCHRSDASGTPGTTPAMNGISGQCFTVPGGREYLIRVPGVATAPWNDDALANLMNWTLCTFDRNHMPEDFVPYTAGEVAALRKDVLRTNAENVRAALAADFKQGGEGPLLPER
ncbi:MAG: cytochrome C [Sphingomonadales bacterium]